jgi:threonine synthase
MGELICSRCRQRYAWDEKIWRCACGGLLDIAFTPSFPLDKIARRKPAMWRYREALPILRDENIVSFHEGYTPLLPLDVKGRTVLIKQDHLFPTGSFKDRGASLLVSKVKELGIKGLVEDSSGNSACAVAAYCAMAGIRCEIFVPESTSAAKLAQIRMYGAALHRIPGSREDTAQAALAAAEESYYGSHTWNPFFFHGTKTFAFEICEQQGWKAPQAVVLPVGNGTIFLGAYLGFQELRNAGLIERIPKLIGVQAARCAPLYKAFSGQSREIPAVKVEKTIAEGIAIARPARGGQILDAVEKSGGEIIPVKEEEIRISLRRLCREGFYIEPTAAATTAGLSRYLSKSDPDETVVSVFTGHGLKSTEKMLAILKENTNASPRRTQKTQRNR